MAYFWSARTRTAMNNGNEAEKGNLVVFPYVWRIGLGKQHIVMMPNGAWCIYRFVHLCRRHRMAIKRAWKCNKHDRSLRCWGEVPKATGGGGAKIQSAELDYMIGWRFTGQLTYERDVLCTTIHYWYNKKKWIVKHVPYF